MAVNLSKSVIISWALKQVGYKESGTNINKYAADIDKNYPDFYNGKKQGAEWCDVFVDDGFINCYGEANARSMLYQPKKSAGAGCKYSARYFRAFGAWSHSAQTGDQIFFGKEGYESHTGLVVEVDGGKITTVEGNKGNAVKKCVYDKTDKSIAGYGRPKYTAEPVPDSKPDFKPDDDKGGKVMVELNELKQGSKGNEVKTLQRLLKELGYKGSNKKVLAIDGSFGSNTLYAVKAFQKASDIGADGVVGQKTWDKLLKG